MRMFTDAEILQQELNYRNTRTFRRMFADKFWFVVCRKPLFASQFLLSLAAAVASTIDDMSYLRAKE